jgi:hypothetical protein
VAASVCPTGEQLLAVTYGEMKCTKIPALSEVQLQDSSLAAEPHVYVVFMCWLRLEFVTVLFVLVLV